METRIKIYLNSWSKLRRIYMGQTNNDSISILQLVAIEWPDLKYSNIVIPYIVRNSNQDIKIRGHVQ